MNFNSILETRMGTHLKSNESHIWFACLPDNEKNIPYFVSILSKDECQKANSFRFPKDQKNLIISRGILKCLLGRYLEQEPQEVEIIYGLWGKPCLVEQSLHFNLSHSRDYVLYAVTRSCEVGIDIEYVDPTLDLEGIVLSILSPQELAFWENIKPEEKLNTFFKLWVCKEAFLKAMGKGWLESQYVLTRYKVSALKQQRVDLQAEKKIAPLYYFESIPGYASALYINGPPLIPLHYNWNHGVSQELL